MARVDLYLQGKDSALEEIIGRYSQIIYRYAYALIRNHQDTEDLVQEAFINAFRGMPRFRKESSLGTWLHQIVYRKFLDKQRAELSSLKVRFHVLVAANPKPVV